MDCIVHGVAKSRTRLSLFHFLGIQRNNPKYREKALSPKRLFAALSVRTKHMVGKKMFVRVFPGSPVIRTAEGSIPGWGTMIQRVAGPAKENKPVWLWWRCGGRDREKNLNLWPDGIAWECHHHCMGHSDFFFFFKFEASIAVGEILLEINYVEQSCPFKYIIQDFTTAGSSPGFQAESNLVRTISILPAARSAPLWEKELTLIRQNIRKVSYLIYSKNYTASHLDPSETGRHLSNDQHCRIAPGKAWTPAEGLSEAWKKVLQGKSEPPGPSWVCVGGSVMNKSCLERPWK